MTRDTIEPLAPTEALEMHLQSKKTDGASPTTHIESDVKTIVAAEDVSERVYEELANHGVAHATVEPCPPYDDRSTHLNDHTHHL